MDQRQGNDYEKAVFTITVADVQLASLSLIGRELTDEELDIVKDGLEWGLLTDIDTVYNAAIDEAIRITAIDEAIRIINRQS